MLSACADAAPADRLVVAVRVTGAVERNGTYVQAGATGCHADVVRLPPGPTPRVFPRLWVIEANAGAEPPESGFRLQFDLDGEAMRPGATQIRLTAGGRVWDGDELVAGSGFTARIEPAAGLASGRFTLTGLRPQGGGAERIAVEGSWQCPAGTTARGG